MCMCGQELGDAHKITTEEADCQQNVKIKLSVTLVKPVNGESNFLTLFFWGGGTNIKPPMEVIIISSSKDFM